MCGIFGIINSKKTDFNKQAFNILGIQNDTRGGDSCGIFIDGKVEYGVGKKKFYEDFYKDSELLKSTNKCRIALGHCRKASVGAINEQNAQPVIIKDENGKIVYVLIHNGTIHNYLDLAKKYIPNVNITGMTDSQVMAQIFYHSGYDVLGEYQGAGVFVMADYRTQKPKLYVFKGESKPSVNSAFTQEERPFYFVSNDNTFMFSSISSYLEILMPEAEAYTVIPNQLIVISSKGVFKVADYDRSEMWQDRSIKSSYYNSSYIPSVYRDYYEDDEMDFCQNFNNNYQTTKFLFPTEDMIYTVNGTRAHGIYIVDIKGTIYNSYAKGCFYVYIWDGIMLYDAKCFRYLEELTDYYNVGKDELKNFFPEIINLLSPYPVKDILYTSNEHQYDKAFKAVNGDLFELFTGQIQMLFSAYEWDYKDGKKVGSLYKNNFNDAGKYFMKVSKEFMGIDKIKQTLFI